MLNFVWFFGIILCAIVIHFLDDKRKDSLEERKRKERELRIAEETLRLENEALKYKFAALSAGKDPPGNEVMARERARIEQ